MQGDIFMMEAM